MAQINRKYLTKLQLPCSIRDMQSAYLNSPHFKDIYLAVSMNKMPSKARTAQKLEVDLLHAVYMIHGGLLYRYMKTPTGDSEPILCVPTSKIDISLICFTLRSLVDTWEYLKVYLCYNKDSIAPT